MRGARQVEVNPPVVQEDHADLIKHARNSAEWYCGAGMKTESMIREKLSQKGYPNGPVALASGEEIDYIETAIEYCNSLYIVYSDESFCEEVARDGVRAGKGPIELRQKFMQKGISQDAVRDCLDEYPVQVAIENGLRKALRSSGVRKAANPHERKQKLIEYYARKGFRFGDIKQALEGVDLED